MPSTLNTFNTFLRWLLPVTVCGAFCFIMAIYPYAWDDIEFIEHLKAFGLDGTISWIVNKCSCRLATIVTILLLYLPKWVCVAIQCLALIISVFMMINITKAGRSLAKMTLLIALFVFAPAWEDSMFCTAYAFGYIVSLPMFFYAYYAYLNTQKVPFFFTCFACLITGMWHESYALTLVAGWGVMWLFDRKTLNKQNVWFVVAVAIGIAWGMLHPGNWHRQRHLSFNIAHYSRLALVWMYFAYLFLWIICIANKSTRQAARRPLMTFALGGAITFPFVILTIQERCAMPAMIVCCCSFAALFPVFCRNIVFKNGLNRWIRRAVVGIIYVFTIVHLGAVVREATILLPIYENIKTVIKNTPDDQRYVFAPVRYSWDASPITMRRPNWNLMFPGRFAIHLIISIEDKNPKLVPVPEELRHYTHGTGEPVSPDGHIRLWRGHLVSDNIADTSAVTAITTYCKWIRPDIGPTAITVFPGADSLEYLYIIPQRSLLANYLGEPIEIELKGLDFHIE